MRAVARLMLAILASAALNGASIESVQYVSSGDAQPHPKVDYFGRSLSYYWPRSTIGTNVTHTAPLFADTPGWSYPSSDAVLSAPLFVSVNSPARGGSPTIPFPPSHTDAGKFPRREFISGTCTLPNLEAGSTAGVYGAHIWLANLLYSEQIAWPFDIFTTSSQVTPNGLDFFFAIPLYSMMESLDHFMCVAFAMRCVRAREFARSCVRTVWKLCAGLV
jgi:hypothetical protein